MKKKNAVKAALICCGIAAAGYIIKKVHDINEELSSLRLDDLTDDLFECEEEKTPNEKNIFVANQKAHMDVLEEADSEEVTEDDFVTEDVVDEAETAEEDKEEPEITLPPEVINKIGKLEDLLTFEGLDFDTNQRDYLYHIIDYMKEHHEMRLALLIGMDHNEKHPLEVFTDNQFAEIKKIIG